MVGLLHLSDQKINSWISILMYCRADCGVPGLRKFPYVQYIHYTVYSELQIYTSERARKTKKTIERMKMRCTAMYVYMQWDDDIDDELMHDDHFNGEKGQMRARVCLCVCCACGFSFRSSKKPQNTDKPSYECVVAEAAAVCYRVHSVIFFLLLF